MDELLALRIILLVFMIPRSILMANAYSTPSFSSNPCFSALNLENGTAGQGIHIFITPSSTGGVTRGTELYFLCCLYIPDTSNGYGGFSFPSWSFIPISNQEYFTQNDKMPFRRQNNMLLLHRTLNVTVTPDINNTEITCHAAGTNHKFESNETWIIVLGPPPPPRPLLELRNYSVIVHWDLVFSWPEYPVTEYTLTVSRSTGEQLYTKKMSNVTTDIELESNMINSQECEELVFSMSASNELGEGEKGSISGGFRKMNGLESFISTVETAVFFDREFVAKVQLNLQTPYLCPYQTLNYSFVVEGEINGLDQIVEINTSSKIADLSDFLTHYVPNLSLQNHYIVYARLTTEGGESVITNITPFNTMVQFPCAANGFLDATIVYALGAVCAVLVVCITVCLCAFCLKYCRSCLMRRKHNVRREMVNPIYSGPIYDSVYDARGRLLNSNASTPSSVGAPEFPPPNGNVKQLESSLMAQNFDESRPTEPRYSTHLQLSDPADTYVKMRAKLDSNDSNGLEAMMDLKEDLVKISDV